jgi:hypothetical protein
MPSNENSNAPTNNCFLPYVDSATAPEDVSAALKTLPFERNIFKVCYISLNPIAY